MLGSADDRRASLSKSGFKRTIAFIADDKPAVFLLGVLGHFVHRIFLEFRHFDKAVFLVDKNGMQTDRDAMMKTARA